MSPQTEGAFASSTFPSISQQTPSPGANIAFFTTNLGVILVQLTPATTPKTVANFENYVNEGAFTGTIVTESQPGSFFLAGSDDLVNGQLNLITENPPVVNEFGASNVRGTIAMPLKTTDPNSATDAFLFNEADSNAPIFDGDKLTVFGNIIGTYGLGVLDSIGGVAVPSPAPLSNLPQLPVLNYTPGGSVTGAQLIQITSVTLGGEGFAAHSDDASVVAVTVTGDNLTFTPEAAGTAHMTVIGVGSDGVPQIQMFTVVVGAAEPATPITPGGSSSLPASLVAGQPAKINTRQRR